MNITSLHIIIYPLLQGIQIIDISMKKMKMVMLALIYTKFKKIKRYEFLAFSSYIFKPNKYEHITCIACVYSPFVYVLKE